MYVYIYSRTPDDSRETATRHASCGFMVRDRRSVLMCACVCGQCTALYMCRSVCLIYMCMLEIGTTVCMPMCVCGWVCVRWMVTENILSFHYLFAASLCVLCVLYCILMYAAGYLRMLFVDDVGWRVAADCEHWCILYIDARNYSIFIHLCCMLMYMYMHIDICCCWQVSAQVVFGLCVSSSGGRREATDSRLGLRCAMSQ